MQELIKSQQSPILIPLREASESGINISAMSYPFSTHPKHFIAKEGHNIAQIIEHLLQCPLFGVYAHVYVNETYIPRQYWERVYPKVGSTLSIKILPGKGGGKKNPLATILSIAVIAAAAWAAPAMAAALGGGTLGTIGGALASAAINAIGGLLISAIAPPPKQRLSTVTNASESQSLFIEGARNAADPYGVVPVILGKHRYVPKLGANTFTDAVGNDQFATQLFIWGMGKYELDNIRIGESSLSEYTDVQSEYFTDGEGSDAVTAIYPNSIYQEELSVEFTFAGSWVQRTTQPGCDKFIVDVTMPQGCCAYNEKTGARIAYAVSFEIQYSIAGAASWTSLGTFTITDATNTAIRRQYEFTVGGVQYDIRIKRTSADSSSDKIFDDTFWSSLKTVTFENPINIKGLSWSTNRIKATDQLNGAIDQLNADVYSVVPSYDYLTGLWTEQTTNNPADLFRWVAQNSDLFYDGSEPLVDSPNARPLADNRIDLEGIEDFHDFCRIRGFEYNAVIDFETSVWDVLSEIASAGRARVTLKDGKWSVIIDREQTVIVQHVTPANSWGLTVNKIFPEIPHALRIQFINEEVGYLQDEMLVYADGYTQANARKIAGLQLPGITKPALIYQHGREHLATITLRPNEYTFNMDVEHLIATRGGLIKFAHDVPLYGVGQGYIKTVNKTLSVRITDEEVIRETDDGLTRETDEQEIISVVLDRKVRMLEGKSYSLRVRSASTNVSTYAAVNTVVGETDTLIFTVPLLEDADISIDDLFMFGETGRETVDLIVRDIMPGEDFTARIVCVDAAPAIFQASQGPIPPFVSMVTTPPNMLRPLPPQIINIQTGISAQVLNPDGSVTSRMVITLQNNNPFDVVAGVKIKSSDADVDAFGPGDVVTATADKVVIENLVEGVRYDIQLYYKKVMSDGVSGIGGTAYSPIIQRNLVLFEGGNDRPPDITNLVAQVMGSTMVLTFDPVDIIDLLYYEVRYSPNVTGVSWYTSSVIKSRLLTNETVVPAGTGTYLVKAFDRTGNESLNAATTSLVVINERFNAVEIVDEHPIFPGAKTNTVVNIDRLELDDYALEGEYLFDDVLDLGSVFTARIIGHLVAAGRTQGNTMNIWPTLDLLGTLSGGNPTGWYATLLVSLTSDDPTGTPTWTPYEPITVSDYTFRAIRAKLVMAGNGTNVTPSIEELRLVVDMEDRVEKALNVTVPDTGLTVTYVDAFNTTPTLVPALLDGEEGDVVSITGESETGFTYTVYNGGVGVERHINYHVIGYGRVII